MTRPLIKSRHGLFETFNGILGGGGGGPNLPSFGRIDFLFSQLTEYDNYGWTFFTKKKRSEHIVFAVCLHFSYID